MPPFVNGNRVTRLSDVYDESSRRMHGQVVDVQTNVVDAAGCTYSFIYTVFWDNYVAYGEDVGPRERKGYLEHGLEPDPGWGAGGVEASLILGEMHGYGDTAETLGIVEESFADRDFQDCVIAHLCKGKFTDEALAQLQAVVIKAKELGAKATVETLSRLVEINKVYDETLLSA